MSKYEGGDGSSAVVMYAGSGLEDFAVPVYAGPVLNPKPEVYTKYAGPGLIPNTREEHETTPQQPPPTSIETPALTEKEKQLIEFLLSCGAKRIKIGNVEAEF